MKRQETRQERRLRQDHYGIERAYRWRFRINTFALRLLADRGPDISEAVIE